MLPDSAEAARAPPGPAPPGAQCRPSRPDSGSSAHTCCASASRPPLFIQRRTFTGSIRIYHRTLGVDTDVAGALLVHSICSAVRDLESPLTKHRSLFILTNESLRRKRDRRQGWVLSAVKVLFKPTENTTVESQLELFAAQPYKLPGEGARAPRF